MASFPTAKVHRPSRRKLGKGQHFQPPQATVTATVATVTVTLTFNSPVVVSGTIPCTYSGGITIVSQAVVSPTVVTQTVSSTAAAATLTFPSNPSQVKTYQGGGVGAYTVTF